MQTPSRQRHSTSKPVLALNLFKGRTQSAPPLINGLLNMPLRPGHCIRSTAQSSQCPAREAERDSSPSCIMAVSRLWVATRQIPASRKHPAARLIDPRRPAGLSVPLATSTAETARDFVFYRLAIAPKRSPNTNKRRFGGAPFAYYIFHPFVITRQTPYVSKNRNILSRCDRLLPR